MKCPFCNKQDTQVIESRPVDEGLGIRRRRECLSCGKRFTTHERTKKSYLWVIKKDGRRELFEKDKAKGGILRAIEKRPVSIEWVDQIIDEIERKALSMDTQEVSAEWIGKEVLKKLKNKDNVSW